MVEILWKTDGTGAGLQEKEFFEFRLVDLGAYAEPRFLVREIHATWSESHQRVMWDHYEDDLCRTPDEAQHCYDTRRGAVIARGFK